MLSYRIAGSFQFLSKGAFLLYVNFRKVLLINFRCWYKLSLLHIYDYLERRKRRGLRIPFSIHVHLLVCYMFPVGVLRHIFLFWNIEIFYFFYFGFGVLLYLARLFVSFHIAGYTYSLTYSLYVSDASKSPVYRFRTTDFRCITCATS